MTSSTRGLDDPRRIFGVLVIFAALSTSAMDQRLRASTAPLPGDRVPNLGELVDWPHGAPVPSFEPGRVYVLDFWATWCPPCYPMIDELSALAREHREDGLVIVGLTVGTDLGIPLPRFLDEERSRIDYTIAAARDDGELEAALLHPALNPPDDPYLPHLMIVDRSGHLAWVSETGDPKRGFELALRSVLSDRWNLEAEVTRVRRMLEAVAAGEEQLAEAKRLSASARVDLAVATMTALASEVPAAFADEAIDFFQHLLCIGEEISAFAYGRKLVRGALEQRVPELLRLHRAIILTPDLQARDLELAAEAVYAAQRVKEDDDPDLVYELAKISLLGGDTQAAGALQAEAVRVAERTGRDSRYVRTIRDLPIQRVIESQARQFECSEEWLAAASHPAVGQ